MQKKNIILDPLYAPIIYIANDKSREIKVCIILGALSFSAIHTTSPIPIFFQTILNHTLLFPYSPDENTRANPTPLVPEPNTCFINSYISPLTLTRL